MKALARVPGLRALAVLTGLLVVLLGGLVACGPVVPAPKQHFCLVVTNVTDMPDDVDVRWAVGGVYVGSTHRTMPPHADTVIVMGEAGPELVEFSSTAFTTAWGPPDWSAGPCFHVVYPTGFVWSGPF